MRTLVIVAHHDDDLLFCGPDLLHDLRDGNPFRAVFLCASNYHQVDRDEYMISRERGIRYAYARLLGQPESAWQASPYSAGGVQATLWTLTPLGDQVTIVELRISDTSAQPVNQLWNLYTDDEPLTTVAGDQNPPQQLDRATLRSFLQGVITDFQPDVVRTLDPTADLHANEQFQQVEFIDFHRDHVATGRMVQYALEGLASPPQMIAYRDYMIRYDGPNLAAADETLKRQVFLDYGRYDPDICDPSIYPSSCPPTGGFYDLLMTRQYQVTTGWIGGLVVPLPEPGPTARPVMGGTYRVVNRATGLELAVENASPYDEARIISWSDTGTPNQQFQLYVDVQGWLFVARHSGRALDMPNSSMSPHQQVIQFQRTGNPNQALRMRGDAASGYLITFAHSGMALTATGGLGSPIVQEPVTRAADQMWDLVPV